jgi:transmembrane sensor
MKPAVPWAESVEAAAAGWVVRQQAGLDPAGEHEFALWRDAAPEHAAAFRRLDAMAQVFQRARTSGASPAIVTGLRVRARSRSRRRMLIAASVAGLFAFGAWQWPRQSSAAGPAGDATIARAFEPLRRLPDGSVVELRSGAQIAVKFDAATRRVDLLRGEALFRVEPNATRPFVVSAGGVDVHAVGTAFNVAIAHHAVAVLVTEGKVRLEDTASVESGRPAARGGEDSLLTAGQQAVVDRGSTPGTSPAARISTLSHDEIRRLLAWRVPRFEFDGVELGQAAQFMNRVNRLQLSIADDQAARLKISGDFVQDDPETFARLAAATFGLKLRRDGPDRLLLTRD